MNEKTVEISCQAIAAEIFSKVLGAPSIWEMAWWERQTIKWISSEHEIKSRVLRFIDVFPALKTNRQIARHLKEYLPESSERLPEDLRLESSLVKTALITPGATALATSLAVNRIARWFIAGATMEQTAQTLDKLLGAGMKYSLDILGEATLSDKEADRYMGKYINLIKYLSASRAPGDPAVNVSLKLSSLTPRFNPASPQRATREAIARLIPIFRSAMDCSAKVTIDMEHFQLRQLTLRVFREIMEKDEFRGWDGAGIVAQSYLKDSVERLEELLGWADRENIKMTIRLVKGAYWEQEQVVADQSRWPIPVRLSKADTDEAFEKMTGILLAHSANITSAIASHNIRSVSKAIAFAREMKTAPGKFEIQMLYGMADDIKKALVDMKIPVRVYTPVGEFLPGIAYLVRRILENSSNESFLRRSFVAEEPPEELLMNPSEIKKREEKAGTDKPATGSAKQAKPASTLFVNEPDPRFYLDEPTDAIEEAIKKVRGRLGLHYPCVIGGIRVDTDVRLESVDPSAPSTVVGTVSAADAELAIKAMQSAGKAFAGHWRFTTPEKRMKLMTGAADIMRERKYELAVWQMMEVGKTRVEALADVNEAIDHMNYYAQCAVEIFRPTVTQKKLGEKNYTRMTPRGPGVIISPWNFPLAVLAGLVGSALASGATVVIKPSSSSPVSAALFTQILMEAGFPAGVVNFLPGSGRCLGPALLESRETAFVSFTGSYSVGASIVEKAASVSRSRNGFIKVVAEMGGKNAIIVDESADIDQAVTGVILSAFGFGGQKCSACSRVIVLNSVYGEFTERLVDAVSSIIVGSPFDPGSDYGPLINQDAVEKTEKYVEQGMKSCVPLVVPKDMPGDGFYAAPAVFGDAAPDIPLTQDEIFGPVLCVIRAKNISQALDIANKSRYALTGGIFSRTPSSVARTIREMEAGNLYINRRITGAVVQRQPFGGFKRSGLGSAKAGAADLVRELAVPQTVSEDIVRHGFSPDIGN